ncbi:MAG: hypothetical protein WBA17_13560 [Saprospiraceae bacterium]
MKLLYYNELDTKGLKSKVTKIEKMLAAGDFKSADVKKMRNAGYYRAKLDHENRLLFQFAEYGGETYLLLLEVIPNHDYDKSKFLRGAEVKEENFLPAAEPVNEHILPLRYVNPRTTRFHMLDKVISLDGDQDEIYQLPAPHHHRLGRQRKNGPHTGEDETLPRPRRLRVAVRLPGG